MAKSGGETTTVVILLLFHSLSMTLAKESFVFCNLYFSKVN